MMNNFITTTICFLFGINFYEALRSSTLKISSLNEASTNAHIFRRNHLGCSQRIFKLKMTVYSPEMGIPTALIEERDACGVGFIASLSNEPNHDIIKQALAACTCMEHRGATSADNISGDGAGIMTTIPWNILSKNLELNVVLNKDGSKAAAVGMLFLPRDKDAYQETKNIIESVAKNYHLKILEWRDVPTEKSVLGELSGQFVPIIQQIVLQSEKDHVDDSERSFEYRLYECRREMMGNFRLVASNDIGYVCSLSSKTIVYKGMLRSCDLSRFYVDLTSPAYVSSFAIYHRRFSTNTVPKWFLAQPMRLLAHNGEINTLLGNINWVRSRQSAENQDKEKFREPHLSEPLRGPLVDVGRSDSANLDSVLESFVKAGYSPEEALMILVPEAYENQPRLTKNKQIRAFYSYYESLQEAWDGPALLVFSDGNVVGATLDRNGLRPARYMLTTDKDNKVTVHVMSEVGVTKALDQFASSNDEQSKGRDQMKIVDAGRLGPGEMLSVNLKTNKLYLNDEIKQIAASKKPYQTWVDNSIKQLNRSNFNTEINQFISTYVTNPTAKSQAISVQEKDTLPIATEVDKKELITMQTFFGWGIEDVEVQISAMASDGVEATYCMGDDAPLAALSEFPHTLYDYFKQRFAQVTNPPIDPLREGAVMSLSMFLGPRGDPLSMEGQSDTRVKIESPILNYEELNSLSNTKGIKVATISTLYPLIDGLKIGGLKSQLDKLCEEVVEKVQSGINVINLSDKLTDNSQIKSYADMTYIPPLIAVGSVHHRLIELGLRTNASIIVTTGQAWSTHHFACLIGNGASAVIPFAAYDAVLNWHGQKRNQLAMARGDIQSLTANKAMANFRKAVDKGLLKILSKMGISLLSSYHGAQIFEALGIDDSVMLTSFRGTPCRVSGLNYDDIAAENIQFARTAFGDQQFSNIIEKVEESESDEKVKKLFNYGFLNYFKSGEYHHNNQPLIKTLHSAIRNHDADLYQLYEENVKSRPPTTLRDVLQFTEKPFGREPIPLESVESAESIMKRFCTGGMSLGALSREAHETLAIAMNRIGGRSNSGEGGEDPIRMYPIQDVDESTGISSTFPHLKGLKKGDFASSRIKQVASGRFGVTPQYLMSADQLEIKIAQGAKPGEGGQLPGGKIDAYIATLRKSKPGVTLISPPPHHDIYSIEDLAQLIYDLHQINPQAAVSVKLVSEVGIGTIASGVTKAGADIIQIAGHDGGTGASPASSIKYAGSPWELGLVESHAALIRNGLRDRVVLRVDGGLKSGWDVVMAAAMGAEEYGFGTIALIAEGCIMARICHTNKCPVGVTTQNEALRKRFPGTPDNIVTYFGYVAEEVRHILAKLGFSSLNELIGRPGILQPRKGLKLKKAQSVDVGFILDSLTCVPSKGENFCSPDDNREWLVHGPIKSNGHTLDDVVLADDDVASIINNNNPKMVNKSYKISNTDRSSFSRVSGAIAVKHGDKGFQGTLSFDLTGAAGQSFCAFNGKGMNVRLSGYANDYVCKGMAGGLVVVKPPVNDLIDALAFKTKGVNYAITNNPMEVIVFGMNCALFCVCESASFSMVGNTVLYGATGGKLFVLGKGGERFAVRNSGALAVVEGLGDHGCEYMTAGTVVNLGRLGRNFGAGMTGGLAFIITDEQWMDGSNNDNNRSKDFDINQFVNNETVFISTMTNENSAAKEFLCEILAEHAQETDSKRAKFILSELDYAFSNGKIVAIVPTSEKTNPIITKDVSVSVTANANV
eukprot:gene6664-9146_t